MAEESTSSSVAIVAIVVFVLAVGIFFFLNYGSRVGGGKTVNVELNAPKPDVPKPG